MSYAEKSADFSSLSRIQGLAFIQLKFLMEFIFIFPFPRMVFIFVFI